MWRRRSTATKRAWKFALDTRSTGIDRQGILRELYIGSGFAAELRAGKTESNQGVGFVVLTDICKGGRQLPRKDRP
jgi:hypothetical protein